MARSAEPEPARLSRERIVDAAFRVLEREGWEALSMRRLGQELDVWPMAVYRHFQDKDELVDALVAYLVAEIDLPVGRCPWRSRIHKLLDVARGTLEPLPPELRARLAPVLLAPRMAALSDAGLRILESAGFRGDDAGTAWAALGAYTVGFVEIAPTAAQAQFEYGLERLIDGLELQRRPNTPEREGLQRASAR
ncbi:MAG TPA: helix-turn-helix domain-containing protein [Thermoleophilaceae bacterium]|nr:helix-turn-helix domain-containing protein [Thermoleophilaceae bacterium]